MRPEPVTLALFGPIGMPEMIVIALLGLLIFGRKLPEVGRSLGKSIVEFKRGLADAKSEVQDAAGELPTMDELGELPGGEKKPAPGSDRAEKPTPSS